MLHSRWTLYFYVPQGTKVIGGFADGAGELHNPDGTTAHTFGDVPGYFNVPVPAGSDGKLLEIPPRQRPPVVNDGATLPGSQCTGAVAPTRGGGTGYDRKVGTSIQNIETQEPSTLTEIAAHGRPADPDKNSTIPVSFITVLFTLAIIASAPVQGQAESEPIRSGTGWAIYPQHEPANWSSLAFAGGNLVADRLVTAEAPPNDHNTGSKLQRLTVRPMHAVKDRNLLRPDSIFQNFTELL